MNLVTFDVGDRSSIHQWRRYPVYKDSGVEWLGEIPGHWEVNKLNSIVSIILSGVDKKTKKDEHEVLLCNYVDVYYNDFVSSKIDFLKATATQNEIKRCRVEIDDVLITKDSERPDDIAVPALVVEKADNLLCGYHLSILRPFPEKIDGLYLLFAIKSLGVKAQFSMHAQGITRFGLTYNSIKNVNLPTPPLPEQKAIASYLDKETARIDALVAKKQRLLKLLKEKRTALISHTVTKGLDPAVAMKDSGIEWLGEIPGHWEVKQLKLVCKFLDSRRIPLSSEERATMPKRFPYYGASGIIDYVENYLFDEPLILVAEDGANLFSRSSPLAFVALGKYWVNNHAHILKPNYESLGYWSNLLASIVYDPWVTGSAQPKLTADNLGSIRLPIPPLHEQKAIASHLDKETAQLDNLIEKIRQSIETQKEYRTALISAAVTGKIDVSKN